MPNNPDPKDRSPIKRRRCGSAADFLRQDFAEIFQGLVFEGSPHFEEFHP